jgi:hypothetical protein
LRFGTGGLQLIFRLILIILLHHQLTNTVTITFVGTTGNVSPSNYEAYRRIKRFNSLRTLLESVEIQKAAILLNLNGVSHNF